jgi:hypothetical protein
MCADVLSACGRANAAGARRGAYGYTELSSKSGRASERAGCHAGVCLKRGYHIITPIFLSHIHILITYTIHTNLEKLDRGYHITYKLLCTKTLSALHTNLASSHSIHSFSRVVVDNELMHRIACWNSRCNLCGCLLSSSIRTMYVK